MTPRRNTRHVVPNPNGGWSVRKYGAERATRVFPSQEAAVAAARLLAQAENTDLYIHARDGSVRQKHSFRRSTDPNAG